MPIPKPLAHLLSLKPYISNDAQVAYSPDLLRLSFNEGAFGPSPKAREAYQAAIENISIYPDLGYKRLRGALADHAGCNPDRIVCGAGSDELISLLTRAYATHGDEVLQSQYGFAMFPIAARSVGAVSVLAPETNFRCDVDAYLARVTDKTRVVFLANPNNPTGSYIPFSEVRRLHAGLPRDVLFVLDAAYAEFMDADDYEAGCALVNENDNVVVTRTFSKIYALGGLRIGWAYCPPVIADTLNRCRSPFNVSAAAEAAAIAALHDQEFVAMSRQHNKKWVEWLSTELRQLGFVAHPSVANFVLAGIGSAERADALFHYLNNRSIQLRPMAGYGLPDHLRITIGREEHMKALVAAMKDFCSQEAKL